MSLTYPFGWDQGLFAWVGGVIAHGGLPYRDAWDFKGPLVYYTYALAQALFGVHLWSIRLLDGAFALAAAFSVRRGAATLTDSATARWAAVVFLLWYASHSYWNTAQPDGWTGMLLIIVLAPLLGDRPLFSARQMIVIGACVGVATLLKPLNAAYLLLPLAGVLTSTAVSRWRSMALAVVGWVAPIAVVVAWFAAKGGLTDLIDSHLRYAAIYVGLSPAAGLRGLVEYLLSARVMAVGLPAVAYGGWVLWQTKRSAAVVLVTWIGVTTFSVVVQNRYYAYHWLPLLPAATLLGAVALHDLAARTRVFVSLVLGAVLLHCLAPIGLEEARFAGWLAGRIDRDAYYTAYGAPGDDMKAVRWFRESAQPGTVFVFGWHPVVPWLSERQSVSRFGYSLPLLMGNGLDIRDRYRAEALDALRAAPPRYIIVGTQSEHILGNSMTIADFPALAELVNRSYRPVVRFGEITIYELG
jgi:hypothetical protein